ncbi:hypothetical protein U1707_18140 [Sphingomonas sp. PB2P12]|uniref:hypothetical protein n=1 Tax=Sphingomonas sandaracina TaxID=3096157 RepID=UPI002FC930EB
MMYIITGILLVVVIATGWYIYSKMLKSKRMRSFARKRGRDAAAWQKVLDQNAADRAKADLAANRA